MEAIEIPMMSTKGLQMWLTLRKDYCKESVTYWNNKTIRLWNYQRGNIEHYVLSWADEVQLPLTRKLLTVLDSQRVE